MEPTPIGKFFRYNTGKLVANAAFGVESLLAAGEHFLHFPVENPFTDPNHTTLIIHGGVAVIGLAGLAGMEYYRKKLRAIGVDVPSFIGQIGSLFNPPFHGEE